MKNTILFGDCRDTLPTIDVKARMCVTSPPYYGLRNYGGEENQIGQEDTPEQFIDNLVDVFRSVRDVLTDDGTLWVNIGDSYYNYRPGKGQALVKQTLSKTEIEKILKEAQDPFLYSKWQVTKLFDIISDIKDKKKKDNICEDLLLYASSQSSISAPYYKLTD